MLLRSSSSPILKSWAMAAVKEPSPAAHLILSPSNISIPSSSSSSLTPSPRMRPMITRALSESDLSYASAVSKRLPFSSLKEEVSSDDEGQVEQGEVKVKASASLGHMLSSSGLDGLMVVDGDHCGGSSSRSRGDNGGNTAAALVLEDGYDVGGGGGMRILGGGGGASSDGGGDDGFEYGDTDAHYVKMIEYNPGNALLLLNYAKFLKEVRGDVGKAEEYCERAILAGPGNGDALALYADLIWDTTKDADRAEKYFEQAVQAAPQDCYIQASHARFLWDANDEEEEEQVKINGGTAESIGSSPPPMVWGISIPSPSVAAAS